MDVCADRVCAEEGVLVLPGPATGASVAGAGRVRENAGVKVTSGVGVGLRVGTTRVGVSGSWVRVAIMLRGGAQEENRTAVKTSSSRTTRRGMGSW